MIRSQVVHHVKEQLMGHSIGLDDHYFTPGSISETYVIQEYLKGVDNLTINEENRLRIKLDELAKKNTEIEAMESRHKEEIETIHKQMSQVMMMAQHTPRLANIKPEILVAKNPI